MRMLHRRARIERVSVRLIAAAALAALYVLLSCGSAYPDDRATSSARAARTAADLRALEALELLAPRAQPDSSERIARVRALISSANQQRLSRLGTSVMKTAWSVAWGVSPRQILSGLRSLGQSVDDWNERRDEDRRALLLVEREIRAGSKDPELRALYEDLSERWEEDRSSGETRSYERLLEQTGFENLRVLIEGSGSTSALRSRSGVDPRERWSLSPPAVPGIAREPETAEVLLAAYLLAGEYQRARRVAASGPEARLARAAACYLAGEEARAVELLGPLRDSPDATGELARRWLDGRLLDPGERFESAERSHRLRGALFWVGGRRLEVDGAEVSGTGYRVWKKAANPLRLALSIPVRLLRGSGSDSLAIRNASREYLAQSPEGEHAAAAAEWLFETEPAALERFRASSWYDGRFILPRARTNYRSLLAPPVLVSRALLEELGLLAELELREALADGPALLLRAAPGGPGVGLVSLAPDAARGLVVTLARSVEQRRVRIGPSEWDGMRSGSSVTARALWRSVALSELQRLDGVLARGSGLVLEAWPRAAGELPAYAAGTFDFLEGEMEAGQSLFSGIGACPGDALCLDHRSPFLASVYAHSGSGFRLGARTEFQDASLSVELVDFWPRVSLVLPISRWLRVDRWIALEARLDASPTGVSAVPSFIAGPGDVRAPGY